MGIDIKQLFKFYHGKAVLDDLDLQIRQGCIFGLLGINGAGKTTLVSILNFLTKPDSGMVKILGYDLYSHSRHIKSISSFVPQNFAFYPNLTAYENLQFFGALYGLKGFDLKRKIEEVGNLVSIQNEFNVRAKYYSGGYQRRLNLAIGLLNNPQILYLDEPTVGVDAHTRGQILQTIKKLNKERDMTVFYTSHYMEEIEYICDDIALIHQGNIILHEQKETLLKQNQSLENIFINLTKEDFIH